MEYIHRIIIIIKEQSSGELLDNFNQPNIQLIWIPECEEWEVGKNKILKGRSNGQTYSKFDENYKPPNPRVSTNPLREKWHVVI